MLRCCVVVLFLGSTLPVALQPRQQGAYSVCLLHCEVRKQGRTALHTTFFSP